MIKRRFREIEFDDSCVLYIPFYKYGLENGDLVIDHSQYNNDGTRYGAQPGEGWEFDGVDDYIDVGDIIHPANTYDFTKPYTWFFLLRRKNTAANGIVIGRTNGDKGNRLRIDSDGTIHVVKIHSLTGNWYYERASNEIIDLNEWCTVCNTYDGSKQRINDLIYLNGQEVTYTDAGFTSLTLDTDTFPCSTHLGANGKTTPGGFFQGSIALVMIFNRVLSPDEIQNLHHFAMRLL